MKKIIAVVLSIIVGAFGYTIVDSAMENRVSTLESQVESLEKRLDQHLCTVTSYHNNDDTTAIHNESTSCGRDNPEHSTSLEEIERIQWPTLKNSMIVAGYPAYSNGSAHWGIDICIYDDDGKLGNTRGAPIYASQDGEVVISKNDGNWNSGFGNYCVIDHGNGIMTLYAQADDISVKKGEEVKKGQLIGQIGATGNVTGPHLHFEVRVKNVDGSVSRVNPLDYVLLPPEVKNRNDVTVRMSDPVDDISRG